jgi:hypothetical protein
LRSGTNAGIIERLVEYPLKFKRRGIPEESHAEKSIEEIL